MSLFVQWFETQECFKFNFFLAHKSPRCVFDWFAIGGARWVYDILDWGHWSLALSGVTTWTQCRGEMLFVGRVVQKYDGYPSYFHLVALLGAILGIFWLEKKRCIHECLLSSINFVICRFSPNQVLWVEFPTSSKRTVSKGPHFDTFFVFEN